MMSNNVDADADDDYNNREWHGGSCLRGLENMAMTAMNMADVHGSRTKSIVRVSTR